MIDNPTIRVRRWGSMNRKCYKSAIFERLGYIKGEADQASPLMSSSREFFLSYAIRPSWRARITAWVRLQTSSFAKML